MAEASILRSSAVMAAGTVFSRLSGFVRGALLAAALGNVLHADVFNIANTIPNMLYILLAGGVVNAVLVPQLVRSLTNDEDGGEAYTNRVITLAAVFLGAVTVLLVVFAPLLMDLFVSSCWSAHARDSTIAFARLCLPQVFFYGMFVLVGQVLNARGRFGPMMWAPIANNAISIVTLVAYLVVFGPDNPYTGVYGVGREWLLGAGSTLGIAVQLLVLIPYLRAAGVRFRPRYDFRDEGLAHTLRLGVWTVLFVIVNQVAFSVVVHLASSGTACGNRAGTGYTVYSQDYIIIMVPHAIITVSLATAMLPRLSARAAAADLPGLARQLAPTLRQALAAIVPFAALLPFVAGELVQLMAGYGSAAHTVHNYVLTLILFAPGLVLFTVHFIVLRGFYAIELNRTVFYIQCAVAVTNVVVAVMLVQYGSAQFTAPALALAFGASYLVGGLISYAVLSRRLGGLFTGGLVRFLVRLLVAVAAASAAAALVTWLLDGITLGTGLRAVLLAVFKGSVIGGVDLVVLIACGRAMRISEITSISDTVTSRLRRATMPLTGRRRG